MADEHRSRLIDGIDDRIVDQIRHFLAQQTGRAPGEITIEQINEQIRLLLSQDDHAETVATIRAQFEAQVAQQPDSTAMICGDEQLSYRELNRRANQLARRLQAAAIAPDSLVGVALERSAQLVIALLGIVKAGAGFVLFDPADAPQHLARSLAGIRLSALLTRQQRVAALPVSHVPIICIDDEPLPDADEDDLATEIPDHHTAYAVFSAGRYALIPYRALTARIQNLQEECSLSSADAVLQHAALSRDAAICEIFWPLLGGARLVMPPPTAGKHPPLAQLIADYSISVLRVVPADLADLLAARADDPQLRLDSLRCVLCEGEPLGRALVDRFFQHLSCALYNLYAPPEAAMEVTIHRCQPGYAWDVLPLGQPTIWPIYVLDRHMQPVPPGIRGEIYLAGDDLMRGYAAATAATAEALLPDPFAETPGARMFRTGDLGRWLSHGALELLGSREPYRWHRGLRLDLRDVTAILLGDTGIDDAALLLHTPGDGAQKLVAYIVPGAAYSLERLQAHVQTLLPPPMQPEIYVPLARLPLTAAGEIDVQALARIDVVDPRDLRRFEEQLRALPGVDHAAVIMQEQTEDRPPFHLWDLLPGRDASPAQPDLLPPGASSAATTPPDDHQALAIAHAPALPPAADPVATLPDLLRRAAAHAAQHGVVYLQEDDTVITSSYAALLAEAQRVLGGLRRHGLQPGAMVIFQIDRNQDFIPAFWGCVLGGFVPVPLSIAPTYDQMNNAIGKLHNAWRMLGQPPILCTTQLAPALRSLDRLLDEQPFDVVTVDRLRASDPDTRWHVPHPEDLALLLLTSGSSGVPKAVMLNHRNIISRSAGTAHLNRFSEHDISLNWMPLDHVGGIVMFHVLDTYLMSRQIHAPTSAVLQDPLRWLDWIERYRASITWAPNFAYGLIVDRAATIARRTWDLSSMRFILNGGEAIVARTARRFLEILQPHGLAPTAMHPAWGMSETSSGVTFSDTFARASTSDDDPFVEVGRPIPGVALRIVDADNRPVAEDTIGRLQVKGLPVTVGYYQHPQLNQEAFTDDGWFSTGDLGRLRDGRLTITGREKDVIIVNGVNYYSHEIEATVEELDGVDVSYTAACSVKDRSRGGDTLAIFFASPRADWPALLQLIAEIRGKVVRSVGINPEYLIPVPHAAIPKTAIGKIQRSQLKQQFEAGAFDTLLKTIDLHAHNQNTLPSWFYKKIWRRKAGQRLVAPERIGQALVFLDHLGLGASLAERLDRSGTPCIRVERGDEFAKLDPRRYRIDPRQPEHYHQLMERLSSDGPRLDSIFHLWTYDTHDGAVCSLEALIREQDRGVYSLLWLTQALARRAACDPLRLFVVSSHSQAVAPGDKLASERTPLLGLLKTIPHELSWLDCRHIDLPIVEPADNALALVREAQILERDREVVYRDDQRMIPRLQEVDLPHEPLRDLPFKAHGMYLITGGLGGIGIELSQYLLRHYQARLLLVGRTRLPERSAWQQEIERGTAVAERLEAFLALEQHGGQARYEAVDICDSARLDEIVSRAQTEWGCTLDGILHLAGELQERALVEETPESFAATLRPKVEGTWALHQLVNDHPERLFVSFASVNSFFGGATVGAYSAANRFLEAFAQVQADQYALASSCYHWSMWSGVGMSRSYRLTDATRARGFQLITARQGLQSFLAALHRGQPQLFIGLDGGNQHLRQWTEEAHDPRRSVYAFVSGSAPELAIAQVAHLMPSSVDGKRLDVDLRRLEALPLLADGQVDRRALLDPDGARRQGPSASAEPQTDVERIIAAIWKSVLDRPQIGVHDNFFDLGGHSLLMAQVHSRLRETFDREIRMVDLFKYPTIRSLAAYLAHEHDEQAVVRASRNDEPPHAAPHERMDIAIIGMSGRFPGASSVEAFWENLRSGVESITVFSDDELL
ncbi:MAG TPA: SDR family NAD(P)-dependent oxidoreductase, partial [Herpetosiphonaceae bacterium]